MLNNFLGDKSMYREAIISASFVERKRELIFIFLFIIIIYDTYVYRVWFMNSQITMMKNIKLYLYNSNEMHKIASNNFFKNRILIWYIWK